MIDRENHRRLRHSFDARHLNAAKESLRHQPDNRRDGATDHVRSPRQAAYIQINPAMTMATGTMRNARSSEVAAEIVPMIGGEGMSPRKCMMNTDMPRAVARSAGATALMIAELTGPVLMKIRI